MPDLIDRGALIDEWRKSIEYAKAQGDSGMEFFFGACIHQVQTCAPAVDAVPVVRCKDCKHFREVRTKRYKQLIRMCCRMGRHDMEFRVNADDFCSYGERRTDNAAD